MTGEDDAAVACRIDSSGVQVAGLGVGEVVAVALGPADEVVGVAHVHGQAGARVGAVEGDRGGRVLLAEQPALLVPGVVEAGAGPAVLGVEVVGLPGDVGQHEQQVGGIAVANGEGDVAAVAVDGGEDGDVGARGPEGGDLQPPGEPPVVAGDGAVHGERRGLDDAGEPGAGGDLRGAHAPVVTDAVDVHAELLRRVDGDAEVDGLAGGDGADGGEALDLAVDVVRGARPGSAGRRDAGSRRGRDRVHVPGDDLPGVVEVVLPAAQPGQWALAEGIRNGVRECSGLPAADLLRPHVRSLP